MKRLVIIFALCLHCFVMLSQSITAITEAAEKGDIYAQKFLGNAYFEGSYKLERDLNKSYNWYLKAAMQGDAEAQYEVAMFERKVYGDWQSQKSFDKALQMLKISADNDYAPAQVEMAKIAMNTKDGENYAFSYCFRAVQQQYAPAYIGLADCYYYGIGTDRNMEEAKRLYELAVTNGDAYANLGLGYCAYEQGDYASAKNYSQNAIDADITQGYNDMAYLYAEGKGVNKDFNEAHRLIDIAITKYPKHPNFYDSKGEFYLMEGKIDKAKDMWQKVIALDPKAEQRTDPLAMAMMNSIDNNIPESSSKSEKTFALIIANEDYKRVTPVPFAKNDGNVFAEYCKKTLGVPEKNVYLVENATLGDMKYHVNLIKKIADAFNGEARVIFYYAGHGIPDESQRTSYLLPVDGYGNDATSGYSLENLYTELAAIPAKSVMVFMDACFSGAQRDGSMLVEARGVTIKPREEMPTGKLVVFSAAQGDETAYPYTEKKHGMFTYYLLKKLQDTKGETTLGELMNYVTTEVKQQSILQNKKSQTPKITPSQAVADTWQNMKLK